MSNTLNLSEEVRSRFTFVDNLDSLSSNEELSVEERKSIVSQALLLIAENYAHLPLKCAMNCINPVQRLKLLLQSLDGKSSLTDTEFHQEMLKVFTSLRDRHSSYYLPEPLSKLTAFLPFKVECYFEEGSEKRKYLVSHLAVGTEHETFKKGVEILYWNGVEINKAVYNIAERSQGSNREARHALGLQLLTSRVLRFSEVPDEKWVIVTYKTSESEIAEIRVDWFFAGLTERTCFNDGTTFPADGFSLFETGDELPPVRMSELSLSSEAENSPDPSILCMDHQQAMFQEINISLFAHHVIKESKDTAELISNQNKGDHFNRASSQGNYKIPSVLPCIFTAHVKSFDGVQYGILRIWTFSFKKTPLFVSEFIRLLKLFPQSGLIIDVRGNGGGDLKNAETILQTLTPKKIDPEPFQFHTTPLNTEICKADRFLPFLDSMQQALQTAAPFSAGIPLTDPSECNLLGQKYFGRVALITDALCYSATDIFAAGFADHDIGPIIAVDTKTGAGGGHVLAHSEIVQKFPDEIRSRYSQLPRNIEMTVAFRRSLRVGKTAHVPLEDLGVVGNRTHRMTKNDLLNGNVDLIDFAVKTLKELPEKKFFVGAVKNHNKVEVKIASDGINRVDIFRNDRFFKTTRVTDGYANENIPKSKSPELKVDLVAYNDLQVLAHWKETFSFENEARVAPGK